MLYARAITLRNCGRFTVVASDFGSDYRTHTHVTGEALYASLTRGATWKPRLIDLRNDPYNFISDYNVAEMPIWFLPGVFLAGNGHRLPDAYLDGTAFNVVHEFYPSTSQSYVFQERGFRAKDRPYHVPTYGTIQAIKPDCRLVTYAFSPERMLLEDYQTGQTFLLGKKRTMFQIIDLSTIRQGEIVIKRVCTTGWYLQLPPDYARYFQSFQILAATMRYAIFQGVTREEVNFIKFDSLLNDGRSLALPDFYLTIIPLARSLKADPDLMNLFEE